MYNRLKEIVNTIGVVPSIAIVALLLLLLWFAFGGIMSSYDSWQSNREIENLKQEADALRQQVEVATKEKDEAIGAAAAYKLQAEQVQNELTELFNERPDLQKQVKQASDKVQAIRNSRPVPVTSNMRSRIDSLGAELERLYP